MTWQDWTFASVLATIVIAAVAFLVSRWWSKDTTTGFIVAMPILVTGFLLGLIIPYAIHDGTERQRAHPAPACEATR